MTTQIDPTKQLQPGAVSTFLQTDGSGNVVWGAGGSTTDYVVASDGTIPTPNPLNDGAGNFIYVGYTP